MRPHAAPVTASSSPITAPQTAGTQAPEAKDSRPVSTLGRVVWVGVTLVAVVFGLFIPDVGVWVRTGAEG